MTRSDDCYHIPVLGEEVSNILCVNRKGVFVDATLGGGGHFKMLAERLTSENILVGIDRDPDAIAWNRNHPVRSSASIIIEQGRFSQVKEILLKHGILSIDGVIADLGVSSFQIDTTERGFSFMKNCRLDMRMNPDEGESAAELIGRVTTEQLASILENMGEIRNAFRMATAIKSAARPVQTTSDLLECLKEEYGGSLRYKVLAKLFMALRIAVNNELEELRKFLEATTELLSEGGRIAVISYHSLEDRIVKDFFRSNEHTCICPREVSICSCGRPGRLKRITRKPVFASEKEIERNPRARSARLRVAEKFR